MARPIKNTVDYFPFICAEGKKMYYLEETYGNDGFATFLKLLRELANTEYHFLDLSKKSTKMFLAAKCKVSVEILENIIYDLVDLGKFDSELWTQYEVVWCQDFIDSIQDAYKKRSNVCVTKLDLITMFTERKRSKNPVNSSVNPVNSSIKPQTKLKETIVKEKRETRASNFLKNEIRIEYDDFEMQNKKNVESWKALLDTFDDTIDIEISQNKIEWETDQLMPRLRKFTRSWISNQNKPERQANQQPTHRPKRY